MATLIKEQPKGTLNRRQWWVAGDYSAVVVYGHDRCGISLTDANNQDVTLQVAKELELLLGAVVNLIPSIDTELIEWIPENLDEFWGNLERI